MFRVFGDAFKLFFEHSTLFTLLILTVLLPENLFIGYLTRFVYADDSSFGPERVKMWLDGIFAPIYLGAMIHALWEIKRGQPVSYRQAIEVGFKNWGRLFAARFVAGLIILVGLVLFIIPGVVLGLRYVLLDCAVIVEGADHNESRRRSTELTKGRISSILGMSLLFWIGYIALGAAIYLPINLAIDFTQLSASAAMAIETAADCFMDVTFGILQVALFLYYWEARMEELNLNAEVVPETSEIGAGFADPQPQLPPIDEDGNPYRSPRT